MAEEIVYEDVNYKGESGSLTVNDNVFHYQGNNTKTSVKCSWARVEKRQLSPETATQHMIKLVLVSGKKAVFTVKNRVVLEEMRDDMQYRMEAVKTPIEPRNLIATQIPVAGNDETVVIYKDSHNRDYDNGCIKPRSNMAETTDMTIPQGKWRDGVFECFKFGRCYGTCHAMCCLGCCCFPILTGQVMTRMSRGWLGGRGPRPSVSITCQVVTFIFFLQFIDQFLFSLFMGTQHCPGGREVYNVDTDAKEIRCPDGTIETPTQVYRTLSFFSGISSFLFFIYWRLILCRTRDAMRKKYGIAAGDCGACEDCCCSICCPSCTIQQMARHTNDYEKYDVGCCSVDCFNNRGQQECVPEIEP